MGHRYNVFGENGEILFQSDDENFTTSKFNENWANGFNGWMEDKNGTVIAGRKPVGTINLAPTWSGLLPFLLTAYRDGSPEGRAVAIEELQRMAKIADGARL